MIVIKNGQELQDMRMACKITAAARALAGEMVRPGISTGEIDKACSDAYIRDASYLGYQKSILLLGHYGAEYAGMRLLAKDLNETVAPTVFLESGEVYRFL